jgi:hypothetical protein
VFGQFSHLTSHPCKSRHKTQLEVSLHNLWVQMIYNVFCEERITLILNIWYIRMMIWITIIQRQNTVSPIRARRWSFINKTELDL